MIREGEFDQTASPRFPAGHCLVRAEVLRDIGGFDLRLGRDDSTLMSGEEVLLLKQLIARGWKIWHSGRIEVGHKIPGDRLKRQWVRKRAFWEGVTTAKVLSIRSQDEIHYRGIPIAVKKTVLTAIATCGNFFDADLRLAFLKGHEWATRYANASTTGEHE